MKMKNKLLQTAKDNKFYIILFFFVLVLTRFFPMSPADDYLWATSDGWKILYSGFENYNGRYLGNLSVIFFIRFPWLNSIVKAFTMTFLIYITTALASGNKNVRNLFAALLLLPLPNFIKTFVWSAGFYNYMFPLIIILGCAYILLNKNECKNIFVRIILFVFGIAGQLFMETYTITAFGAAFCLLMYRLKKHDKFTNTLIYTVGTVIGAVIMFTNGAYMSILRGETDYQKLESSDSALTTLLNAVGKLFSIVPFYMLCGCIPVFILLTVLSVLIVRKNKDSKSQKVLYLFFALQATMIVLIAVVAIRTKTITDNYFIGGYVVAFLAMIVYIMQIYLKSKEKRIVINLLFLSAVLTVPFCVLHPVGSRCFQLVVILFMLIAKIFFDQLEAKDGITRKITSTLLILVCAFNMIVYPIVFFSNQKKIDTIISAAESGERYIELKHTPLRRMVYALDCENISKNYQRRFCEYYGLPQDIIIKYEGDK